MRPYLSALLLAAFACVPSPALAQQEKKFLYPEIKNVRIGFKSYEQDGPTPYKVGLWTPVHVELFGGTEGILPDPRRIPPHLVLETQDNDDVGTRIFVPVAVDKLDSRVFTGYVKTGHIGNMGGSNNEIRVQLNANGMEFLPRNVTDQYYTLDIDAHLYLTLGSKITDLHRAIRKIGVNDKDKEALARIETGGRHVAFENEVERLPDTWFGYNSIDLVILSSENRRFLNALGNQPEKLKALAQWVRRGGRLIVPVAWQNQDAVVALLKSEAAWQPPVPVVPPRAEGTTQRSVMRVKVESWANIVGDPFQSTDPKDPQRKIPIPIALLDPGKIIPGSWDVEADTEEGLPLITRVRYGMGQIVYLAFSLEDSHFLGWSGKEQFLQALVTKIATKAPIEDPNVRQERRMNVGRNMSSDDLTTDLLGNLDQFDVTVIPFGYVALFIVLYIMVVGPLDFLLLKYVFKRLEWTWITFPTVVLAVSVIAYFAAYALKGQDLKINKVDIVDFDLRTDVDAKGQPGSVHAYGASFFTILSPRIQNYTIGLEPNPAFWGEKPGKVRSVDLMSWMGRPSGGFNNMGRSSSSGFFRKPYQFREDASGLDGVPIPVWTTKAFSASWEQTLPRSPFQANLVYHQKEVQGKDLKISGTLESRLGTDLVDLCIIYADNCYELKGPLVGGTSAPPLAIAIEGQTAKDMKGWINPIDVQPDGPGEERNWSSNPTTLIKKLLFLERYDTTSMVRNHLLRPLDFGWRVREEPRGQRDRNLREAILFARVKFASGKAEALTENLALPTRLWLGRFPDPGETRPELLGHLNQDTYIRVLLAIRPADE